MLADPSLSPISNPLSLKLAMLTSVFERHVTESTRTPQIWRSMKATDHYALAVDASSSMQHLKQAVIEVFNSQIAWLARRSKELGRDCRVSLYFFNDYVTRPVFELPADQVPDLRHSYFTSGWTALLDAVIRSQEDLAALPAGFGNDDSFVTFVITDGYENRSRPGAAEKLRKILAAQGNNWTVAALVPDAAGRRAAVNFGFHEGNVTIWETGTAEGLAVAAAKIQGATETHLTARTNDPKYKGTRTMFANQVDAQKIADAGLKLIDPTTFMIIAVTWDRDTTKWRMAGRKTKARPEGVPSVEIQHFVEKMNLPYVLGNVYYRLEKAEKVDVTKDVIILDRVSGVAHGGREARTLIGLSDTSTRIKPQPVTGKYDIYVKSTSFNRLLPEHSKIVIIK